jgi:predicted PurR-regulated permease PerM
MLVVAAAYSWRLLVVGAVALAGLWLLGQLRVVVVAGIVALLLTRVVSPLVVGLRARGLRPALAATAGLLAILAAVAALVAVIGGALADELSELGPTLDDAWADVERWIVEDGPVDVTRAELEDWRRQASDRLGQSLFESEGSLTGALASVLDIPTVMFLSLFLTFFLLKDGTRFVDWVSRSLPESRSAAAGRMGRAAWTTLGGFLRGAAVLGAIEATAVGSTVAIVGGRLVLPIALLTFVAAFVPIVGAIVAGVVAVLVTLVTAGPAAALVVALVALVVQQLDGDLLAPIVYGRMLRLHPIVIVLSVVVAGSLLGLLGAVVAVPAVAVVVNAVAASRSDPGDEPPGGALHRG